MTDFEQITEDEFERRFTLVRNHLNDNACWNGCMFETYGEEVEFVRQQDPRTIWTFIANDDEAEEAIDEDGDEYVINHDFLQSGYHWVNRIGYLITTTPVPEGITIEVRLGD